MLKLIGSDGARTYALTLDPGRYTMGRQPDTDFHLDNRTVSRLHAEIEVPDQAPPIYVTDKGSYNGTFVNGDRISKRTALQPGDKLALGEVELQLGTENDEPSVGTRSAVARFADSNPANTRVISLAEALQLPTSVADQPEVIEALMEMSRMLVLSEPQESMLEKSLELMSRVIPAQRYAVLSTDETGENLCTTVSRTAGGNTEEELCLSRTIVSDVMDGKQAVMVGGPQSDSKYEQQQSFVALGLKAAMAVPLYDDGVVHGVLYIDSGDPRHLYTDDHLKLLASFGNIVGAKLANYRLAEEREQKRIMDAELNRAASIQKRLLVARPQACHGYEVHVYQDQCRAVGGDFYDVHPLNDGRCLVLLGDVSGKGMGAALLMANILASFRILYEDPRFDVASAVTMVSRQLCHFSDPGDYATLFCGVVDPEQHRFTYVNAGHNPPILIKSSGEHDHLEATGLVVGVVPDSIWDAATIDMAPGDFLTVFSDGITEAEGKDGQYGESRLEQTLKVQTGGTLDTVAGRLLGEIEEWTQDVPQSDDITVLMLRRQ